MDNMTKNAILVSLDEDISEIIDLAHSLDYVIIKNFIQKRQDPDVNSYIGSGKLEEIEEFLENPDGEIKLLIINGELKPSQWFKLEDTLHIDVYDRVRLILAIFEERAERKEAKLQVKLAQLQYERPFVRELIHRARSGEHPGFMAGGEYQVDDYYEMIKKQTKKIKEQLNQIRNQRDISRSYRRTGGFYLVSLAGYTNSGKSSILNLFSKEKVKVEDRLFSTLSTITRKIENKNIPILITDTVGFIKNLPSFVIDAFHSTLEEIELADIVLLVADISEEKDILMNKLRVSIEELIEIGVKSPIIITLNKTDLIKKDEIEEKIDIISKKYLGDGKKIIAISAKNKENIDELLKKIYESLPQLIKFKLKIPMNSESQSLISWIYKIAHVSNITYNENIIISIECNSKLSEKILTKSKVYNAEIID